MVLNAYCDESEKKDGGKHVLTVAALMGHQGAWDIFDTPWAEALAEHGVEVFHMNAFENRKSPYDSWAEERRVAFIRSLIGILGRPRVGPPSPKSDPAIGGVAISVIVDEYLATLSRAEQDRLGTPYYVCATLMMAHIGSKLAQAGVPFPVAYVFEERQGQGRLEEAFQQALRTIAEEKRLHSRHSHPKRAFRPLQAADLWAYEACKETLRVIGARQNARRKSLDLLQQTIGTESRVLDGPELRRLIDGLDSGELYMDGYADWRKRRIPKRQRRRKRH